MLNLPVFLGKKMPTIFRCYQMKRSKDAHEPKKFPDRRQKKKEDFRREIIWEFFPLIWTFLPFFARPRAIALGSKPPLVTRIARTGLGTRLWKPIIHFDVTTLDDVKADTNQTR